MEDGSEHKKAKGTKKCVIKHELMFKNYKDSLFNDKKITKSQQGFRSNHHNVCTVENNRTAKNKFKHMIELLHIHMERVFLKYVKMK